MGLDIRAFALTGAVFWGFGLFILTWWMIAFGGASGDPTFLGRVYLGYSVSPLGSVIGLIWAAVDGLIGGAIFAWLYNFLAGRSSQ
jgi:hypothetical protein